MKKEEIEYMDDDKQREIMKVFLNLHDIFELIEHNVKADYKNLLRDAAKEIEKLTEDENVIWGEKLKIDYRAILEELTWE